MHKNNYKHYSHNHNCDIDNNNKIISRWYYSCDDEEYDSNECNSSIICSQSKASKCEAEAFCTVTNKLSRELLRTHKLSDCVKIVALISDFFQASACKEKSIAEVITSYKYKAKDYYLK